MKAVLLFESRRLFETGIGKTIVMEMDLYELSGMSDVYDLSSRYKFSWIAFDQEAVDNENFHVPIQSEIDSHGYDFSA